MSAARLELSRSAVVPGEMITYTVVNDGDIVLMFGFDYGIEQPTADGWRPVNIPRRVLPVMGFRVSPGESRAQGDAHPPRSATRQLPVHKENSDTQWRSQAVGRRRGHLHP